MKTQRKPTDTKQVRFKANTIRIAPITSDWFIDGEYLKMGLKGFIFRHDGSEWVKSTKEIKDIFSALKSEDKYCFSIIKPIDGEKS